jgi:hypothetical protein
MVVQFVYVVTVHNPNRALYNGFLILAALPIMLKEAAAPVRERTNSANSTNFDFVIAQRVIGLLALGKHCSRCKLSSLMNSSRQQQ